MKPGFTAIAFKGTRSLPVGMSRSASDLGAIGFGGENIVEIGQGAAGGFYQAGPVDGTPGILDQNSPLFVYILGTDNYDGLKRIYNVRQGRYIQIFSEFVAETFSGATQRVGFKAETASEFGGFSWHLDVVGTAFDLEVTLHSAKGSAYNSLLWSKDMDGVQDDSYVFNPPLFLGKGDRIDLTYGITGTLSAIFHIRKLA